VRFAFYADSFAFWAHVLRKKVEHAKGAASNVQDAPAWLDAEATEQPLRLTFETVSLAQKTISLVRDLSTENVRIGASHGYLLPKRCARRQRLISQLFGGTGDSK
jgi:hypothetical protein